MARTYITTSTDRELNAFHHLQQLFSQPSILLRYNLNRQLYINLNASKAFGFGAMVYHNRDTSAQNTGALPKKTFIETILFLNQLLMDAETQYWPMELKIVGFVWTIKKVRHMVKLAKMSTIVYTDHAAIVLITWQTNLTTTTATDKLNLQIIEALEYFCDNARLGLGLGLSLSLDSRLDLGLSLVLGS